MTTPTYDGLPEHIGRYRILSRLGKGGMGAVYLAHDNLLDRRVALKVPRFDARDTEAAARFLREARAAAMLDHPGLCPVHDADEADGLPYLTMAHVEGQPLSELIRAGPLTPGRAVALARRVALAMQHAHERGVIHRDLKPANVLLDRGGHPVVVDFGLARRTEAPAERLTQRGQLLGTPAYMAPEQVNGEEATAVTDVYGLGVILYELLTGRLPFAGSLGDMLGRIVREPPTSPSRFRPGLDPGLEAVCLKALAKRPIDRHTDMAAFAHALAPFEREVPRRRSRGTPAIALVAVLALVAVSIGLWQTWKPRQMATQPDREGAVAAVDRAWRHIDAGRLPEAIADCDQAIRLDPTYPRGYATRGMAHLRNGDPDRGITDIDAALKLDPENAEAYSHRGEARCRKAEWELAVADFTNAIRIDPNTGSALTNRAWAYNELGRHDLAIADCNAALKINERTAYGYLNRAWAYRATKMPDLALKDCDRFLELLPAEAEGYELRTSVYTALGRKAEAETDMAKARTLRAKR